MRAINRSFLSAVVVLLAMQMSKPGHASSGSPLAATQSAASTFFWPLPVDGKTSTAANANGIRYSIGPRAVDGYDFHAGLDLLAPNLTPVFAVADGTVTGVNAGTSSEGNQVVISHGDGRYTVYNHMSSTGFPKVSVGAKVTGGSTQLGNVGDTGASPGNYHLHLTYVYAPPGSSYTGAGSNEKLARLPLEILPHVQTTAADVKVTLSGSKVDINMPVTTTVTRITVSGNNQSRTLDYYDILTQGSTARNNKVQSGLGISVTSPDASLNGRITLTLDTTPSGPFIPDSVVLFDYQGNVVYPASPVGTPQVPLAPFAVQTSRNPVDYRQPVVLTAYIDNKSAGGTVNFTIENTSVVLCKDVPVIAGIASCPVPGTRNVANFRFVANYSGDANTPHNSGSIFQLVNPDTATLTATAVPRQVSSTDTLVLNAMVASRVLGGKVTFLENGVALPGCDSLPLTQLTMQESPGGLSVAPDSGIAVCRIAKPVAGNHTYAVKHLHAGDLGFEQLDMSVVVSPSTSNLIDYTDMWWAGAAENGWGMSITQHGALQFIALYVYDNNGAPVFYVLPNGDWSADKKTYSGSLYQPVSSSFMRYDATSFKAGDAVGSATITYTDANTAQLAYTINGASGKKSLTREIFAADDGKPRLQVGDMWWGGIAQNGWGVNIAQQGSMLFPLWYTYDANGKARWFAVPGGIWAGTTCIGDIYSTNSSPWLGATYNPASLAVTKVGTMALSFSDQSNAVMTYTIGDVTQSKAITRQPF